MRRMRKVYAYSFNTFHTRNEGKQRTKVVVVASFSPMIMAYVVFVWAVVREEDIQFVLFLRPGIWNGMNKEGDHRFEILKKIVASSSLLSSCFSFFFSWIIIVVVESSIINSCLLALVSVKIRFAFSNRERERYKFV